jgi:hypothetical protein
VDSNHRPPRPRTSYVAEGYSKLKRVDAFGGALESLRAAPAATALTHAGDETDTGTDKQNGGRLGHW